MTARSLLALVVLFTVAGTLAVTDRLMAQPDPGSCGQHDPARLGDAGGGAVSSPCIHKRREGVLVPLAPAHAVVPLLSVNVEAEATFFSCMVRNFIVNVRAEFVLGSWSPADPAMAAAGVSVAFPITTHALYGDHNRFREIHVWVDNAPIAYRVAIDRAVYDTSGAQLRCKGRLVNYNLHPLLAAADDLRVIAPHLVAKGFDMVLYWQVPVNGSAGHRVVVQYTTNSNDFSSCCQEVRTCTGGSDPYYFMFDLGNTHFWPGPRRCRVLLRDSKSAEWSAVPTTTMQTNLTRDAIELLTVNSAAAVEDLAVPVQPAVFDVWPRRWPQPSPPLQPFEVRWVGGGMIDQALIRAIPATPGINVHAHLPFIVDALHPVGLFSAIFMPPIPVPAYLDVVGGGLSGGTPHGLYDIWLRVPLAGKTIMGHDLAITELKVVPGPDNMHLAAVATVANKGIFADPLVATLLLNNRFLASAAFGVMQPGEQRTFHMLLPMVNDMAVCPQFVEVEIEPIPGEVLRLNNARAAPVFPQPPPLEVLFSIEEPAAAGNVWPPFGHGDEASDRGYVVATSAQLLRNFHPAPTFAAVEHGLDALHELRCCPTAVAARPVTLFSIEQGFFDMKLGRWISDGDLLSDSGCVVASNAQLMANFSPMPPKPDMGLDAVFIPYYVPTSDAAWPPEIWFSTERGWFDERLGRYISGGDLLSTRGYVVATNATLLRNFRPEPVLPDVGLDGVYVPYFRPWHNADRLPEIWFSIEEGFFDEMLGVWISDGDLLSTSGRVIRTNQQLLRNFPCPLGMPIVPNLGLDAVDVRGRALLATVPAMGCTLSRVAGNEVRLVFDGPIELPAEPPLRITGLPAGNDAAGAFDVCVATTDAPDDTLVIVESGSTLVDGGRCRIEPTEALEAEPFALDVGKLVADADGDGVVSVFDVISTVNAFGSSPADVNWDPRCDFDNNAAIDVFDVIGVVSRFGNTS